MWNFDRIDHGAETTAVIDENGTVYSYDFLNREGSHIADKAGGRCLLFALCSNTIGSLIGYVGSLSNRIVPLMLDAHLNEDLLRFLITTYQPAFLWLPTDRAEAFRPYAAVHESYGYSLLSTGFAGYPLHDDVALLLTTSGSTGSPKLVRQSYRNIESNTHAIIDYLKLDATERAITTLPMNYTFGLSIINTHLYAGASIVLTEAPLIQKDFWAQFREFEATSLSGVPYTYEMLDRLRFTRMNLPSLQTLTQAGGRLSEELHRKFAEYAQETDRSFVVMYGQTEATARMSYLPPEKALEKCGSIGIAISNGTFMLRNEAGVPVREANKTGELIYQGDNVMLGYASCGEDLAGGDELKGILATGDLARFDEDGYYFIMGRKARFLKLYGMRINLEETEHMIREAFPGQDCACGGRDDLLTIYLEESTLADAVQRFLVEKTGIHHAAFRVVPVAAIPRNSAGKILYHELAEEQTGGWLAGEKPSDGPAEGKPDDGPAAEESNDGPAAEKSAKGE
jgi:acyl-CoA synthetase (AMP-forming)/AMP-acid ligase II